jgi:hypothetical protein
MSNSSISEFAMFDPGHLLDGLFTPTSNDHMRLYEVSGTHNKKPLRFSGPQLSSAHQSILLSIVAITARQKIDDALISPGTKDGKHKKLLDMLEPVGEAIKKNVSVVTCTRYSLLKDAGMARGGREYELLMKLLQQMNEVRLHAGTKDVSTRLIVFCLDGETLTISLNWRLTDAIFENQNVNISLSERRELSSSRVAKVLHVWLSGYIRPGGELMAGKGAKIDTLIKHVWGKRLCSPDDMKSRRNSIKKALLLINELSAWEVITKGSVVKIKRLSDKDLEDNERKCKLIKREIDIIFNHKVKAVMI